MKYSLPHIDYKSLIFRVFDLHRCSSRYTTKHTLDQSNKLLYDLMLMTKEFNNKHSDSKHNDVHGKKTFIFINKMEKESIKPKPWC